MVRSKNMLSICFQISAALVLAATAILFMWSRIGSADVVSCGKVIVGPYRSGIYINIDAQVSLVPPYLVFADSWQLDQVERHFLGFGWQAPALSVSRPCVFGVPWWFTFTLMIALNVLAWKNRLSVATRKQGFPVHTKPSKLNQL